MEPEQGGLRRRSFLRLTALGALTTGTLGTEAAALVPVSPVDTNPSDVTRTWLGPAYWGNRLQDWRLHAGRLECVVPALERGARTVAVLTRELVGAGAATVTVRTGTLSGGAGFSGFLLGAGGGVLDQRAAALVQGASGTGGGLLCTYESDGRVGFRDHTDETAQFAYATLSVVGRSGPAPARTSVEDVTLVLDIVPTAQGRFDLVLTASATATGRLLSRAVLPGVAGARLRGGLALVSSTVGRATGARYWLRGLRTGGAGIAVRSGRALGPVLGTLYSLNGSVLKLTAQLMPIAATEPRQAVLEFRAPGTAPWNRAASATVGRGYTAVFRVTTWDPTRDWEYRVVYAPGTPQQATYHGTVVRDPSAQQTVVIAMLNCSIHSFRPLDRASSGTPRLPGESGLGLYTTANLYFPYREVAANLGKHQPDLYVAFGDQFYEHRPTVNDRSAAPELDFLYKYYLWLWSFRDLTRSRPTIVLVDDHDVFQGNIWGHEGAAAPDGDASRGGYSRSAGWVNLVQRCQCAHDPDPYDATPVLQGISVYYAAFRYGGIDFAILEDRKWKTGDADNLDAGGAPYPEATAQLLGSRQEAFLRDWAARDPGLPRICLTQTLFGCLQTDTRGLPSVDYDANGYPTARRDAALTLLKQARALVLSGDQHLASVVRHGTTTFGDGPLQFVAPALGTEWQRWFEAEPATGGTGSPHTGDWVDAFGNRMTVRAVANPRVSFADYRAAYPGESQVLGDRDLKSEGYGIVKVDKGGARYVLECWPWQADPLAGGVQFEGWPRTVPFAAS